MIPGLDYLGPSGSMVLDPYGWQGSARVALSPGQVLLTCPADDPLGLDPDLLAWAGTPEQARQVAHALSGQHDQTLTGAESQAWEGTVTIRHDPAGRGTRVTIDARGEQATLDLPGAERILLAAALEDAATLADLPHPDLSPAWRHVPRHVRDALIAAAEADLSPLYVGQVLDGLVRQALAKAGSW